MMYLKDLGFDEETITNFKENIPELALGKLIEEQETITTNINYLKDLGVKNYVDSFVKFYNMFLMNPKLFEEIFSKYDRDDLIAKLEKNVAIMEYL